MGSKLIYVVLLQLIHWAINLGYWMMSHGKWISIRLSYFNSKNEDLLTDVQSRLRKNLPVHIGFVVTGFPVDLGTLSTTVAWVMSIGPTDVTVYDYEGNLKVNQARIRHAVELKLRRNLVTSAAQTDDKLTADSVTVDKPREATLRFTDHSDGREGMVQLSRKIITTNGHTITEDYITKVLASAYGVDPDVLLIVGSARSTMGFMPCQLRVTEIINIADLEVRTVHSALMVYSKCEQRYGK